jgi:uncharacterized protein HemX
MIARQTKGISGIVAVLLAILLVIITVAAGFLWLREADARLVAEQQAQAAEKKYDEIKTQCDAMKNSGQVQGVSLDNQQDPVIAGLESQAEVPQCERPAVQPFVEPMRAQDPKFFASAKEGDVLISYPLSKMVYLYRKSSSTLLNQARIADDLPAQQSQRQRTQMLSP